MTTANTTTATPAELLDQDDTPIGAGAAVTVVKEPDNALVVTNPDQYAKELFEPFHLELRKARRQASSKPYDIQTEEGMTAANEFFRTFQKIRTRADALKAERKAPIDKAGKALLTGFNALAEAAKAEEKKHADAIAAEKKRRADEEQARLDAERARTEALEAKVDAIRQFSSTMTSSTSVELRAALVEWEAKRLDPADYSEYLEDALAALAAAVDQLRDQLVQAEAREAKEEQDRKDKEELERLRAEQAERDKKAAEDKRIADEAAATAAQQLADAQAAAAKQAQIMADLMALNQLGMVDGDVRTLQQAIENARAVDVSEERFGQMAPMAVNARDMAVNMIVQRYQAKLAAELPQAWDEALDEDAQRADLASKAERLASFAPAADIDTPVELAPVPADAPLVIGTHAGRTDGPVLRDFGGGIRVHAAPVIEPAPYQRPTDAELVDVLAKHFDEDEAIVMTWLRDFAL